MNAVVGPAILQFVVRLLVNDSPLISIIYGVHTALGKEGTSELTECVPLLRRDQP